MTSPSRLEGLLLVRSGDSAPPVSGTVEGGDRRSVTGTVSGPTEFAAGSLGRERQAHLVRRLVRRAGEQEEDVTNGRE